MGNSSHDEIGRATYYVLYDDSEQGLLLATNSIPYDYKNTINTLNLSNNHSRKKMQSWIGRK